MRHALIPLFFALTSLPVCAQYTLKVDSRLENVPVAFPVDDITSVQIEEGEESFDPNGYDFVDLGLPSGQMWATYNVGATSPEQFGDYYSFGETVTVENKYMNGLSYADYGYDSDPLYSCVFPYIRPLPYDRDVAHVKMGGSWRMPSADDFQELIDGCEASIDTLFGIPGYTFKSKTNGHTVFFPFSGHYVRYSAFDDWGVIDSMVSAQYLGREFYKSEYGGRVGTNAVSLELNKFGIHGSSLSRSKGAAVRAVSKSGKVLSVTVAGGEKKSFNLSDVAAVLHEPVFNPNGHEYVDLGLPSGLKWAAQNVGASSPSDKGSFFAWGETKTKATFTHDNYLDGFSKDEWYGSTCLVCGFEGDPLEDYVYPNLGPLPLEYDAARANMGGTWRMPTSSDFVELVNNCDVEEAVLDGVSGYRYTSKINGASIFVPCVGYYDEDGFQETGPGVLSVIFLFSTTGSDATYVYGASSTYHRVNVSRYCGYPVRGVSY